MSRNKLIWIAVLLIFAGLVAWLIMTPGKPGKLDTFAECLKEEGTIFYGAFWCPHCQAQKGLFGRSAKLLPYVECSTPNGQGQLPVCTEVGVESYPTWVFADGSRLTGEVPLTTLAEKTQCSLPQ
jgi:hypothetical protein